MNRVKTDYHMHSISPDARVPMEELCEAALERGLSEIAVTDHMELFTPEYAGKEAKIFTDPYMDRYFEQLADCRDRFAGRLVIRSGVELGQPLVNPEKAERILSKYQFDFVLGSVHKLYNVDLAFKVYQPNTVNGLIEEVLRRMEQMADQGDFDVMGHVDLIKRYSARQGCRVDLLDRKERVAEIMRRLIQRGKGIELNTSGLRQGLGETMPGLELLRLYRDLGGEILTIGSDAHAARDVGANLEDAAGLALAAGFTRLAVFENRCPSFYPIG